MQALEGALRALIALIILIQNLRLDPHGTPDKFMRKLKKSIKTTQCKNVRLFEVTKATSFGIFKFIVIIYGHVRDR